MPEVPLFDPHAILGALERRRVAYIVIGAFARVVHGADELTDGVDVVPSLRGGNLGRLELALADLGAERLDGRELAVDEKTIRAEPVIELRSRKGEIKVVPEPTGTRGGHDDLRRAATRGADRQGPSSVCGFARRPSPHARSARARRRHDEAERASTTR